MTMHNKANATCVTRARVSTVNVEQGVTVRVSHQRAPTAPTIKASRLVITYADDVGVGGGALGAGDALALGAGDALALGGDALALGVGDGATTATSTVTVRVKSLLEMVMLEPAASMSALNTLSNKLVPPTADEEMLCSNELLMLCPKSLAAVVSVPLTTRTILNRMVDPDLAFFFELTTPVMFTSDDVTPLPAPAAIAAFSAV